MAKKSVFTGTNIVEEEVPPEEMFLANPEGKSVEELKELAIILQEKVNTHEKLMIKSQGALEVILQLIPKTEVEKMISQENKANGKVVDDAKTAD
tara:strand:+ start:1866 stop:2150 length:285 start_codon:yes stop_codon:yes gene_type:complete